MKKSALLLLAMVIVTGFVFLARRSPTRSSPVATVTAWPLGPPDLVVRLPAAVVIPPHEQDVFRNLVLPTGLAGNRFVRAIDIQPGDPAVVHHAVLKIDATADARRRDEADPGPGFGGMDMGLSTPPEGHFLVWTPGKEPLAGGVEAAWPLQGGSDFVLQLHLPASDSAVHVAPALGLYFSDSPPSDILAGVFLNSSSIDIPAGAADYIVTDEFELPVPVEVLSAFPHAHYLGRTIDITATTPDGTVRSLLTIPEWQFGKQLEYRFEQAIELPAGTRITMRYRYDNSADNPHNPNRPPRRVRFGQQSTDEMASLRLQVRLASMADRHVLSEAQARHTLKEAPGHADLRYELGTSLLHQGKWDEAIPHLQWAAERRPEDPWAWNNLGVALAQAGRLDDAIAAWNNVLAIDSDNMEGHNNLGNAYLARSDARTAVQHYRQSARLAPDNAVIQRNLGAGLAQAGDVQGAIVAYERAVALDPTRADWQADLVALRERSDSGN